MATVALAGASGVVGAKVLEQLLLRPEVSGVVSLGRRSVSQADARVAHRTVDFSKPESLAAALAEPVDVAFCCLGTTRAKAGSKESFRAVDLEAVRLFARAVHARGAKRFLLVSSIGADATSRNFYLRTKGEAEAAVEGVGFEQVVVARPSFIDDEGARSESRVAERLALPVARAAFSFLGQRSRYAPVKAVTIARALVACAFDASAERVRVVESDALHLLGA